MGPTRLSFHKYLHASPFSHRTAFPFSSPSAITNWPESYPSALNHASNTSWAFLRCIDSLHTVFILEAYESLLEIVSLLQSNSRSILQRLFLWKFTLFANFTHPVRWKLRFLKISLLSKMLLPRFWDPPVLQGTTPHKRLPLCQDLGPFKKTFLSLLQAVPLTSGFLRSCCLDFR